MYSFFYRFTAQIKNRFSLRPIEDYLNPQSCISQQIKALRKSAHLTDAEIYRIISQANPAEPVSAKEQKNTTEVLVQP